MFRYHYIIILLGIVGILASCEDTKNPFRAPVLKDAGFLGLGVIKDPLHLPRSRQYGRFDDDSDGILFIGYPFQANQGINIRVTLQSLENEDPVVIIYGPRSNHGAWGTHLALDDDGGSGLNSMIPDLKIPEDGIYLIVATTYNRDGTEEFYLTLDCNSGCEEFTDCENFDPWETCNNDPPCYRGFALDEEGCQTCDCLDECQKLSDCSPSQTCVEGLCQDSCICSENYDPVCGTDGFTYSNSCEAGCNGVEIVGFNECATSCPPIPCTLICPEGRIRDEQGCELCECKEECNNCPENWEPVCSHNGITFQNTCKATCQGELVAYPGRCNPTCQTLECDLECDAGFKRDDRGCPICQCNDVICLDTSAPVCASNGVTYLNRCQALSANTEVVYPDACPPLCGRGADCPDGFFCDQNYNNDDSACVEGVESDCFGVCVRAWTDCLSDSINAPCAPGYFCGNSTCIAGCQCQEIYDPVCGTDNITYDNFCIALCQGAEIAKTGECCQPVTDLTNCLTSCPHGYQMDLNGCNVCRCRTRPACECNDIYNPVCGIDGNWYENTCIARCEVVEVQDDDNCNN